MGFSIDRWAHWYIRMDRSKHFRSLFQATDPIRNDPYARLRFAPDDVAAPAVDPTDDASDPLAAEMGDIQAPEIKTTEAPPLSVATPETAAGATAPAAASPLPEAGAAPTPQEQQDLRAWLETQGFPGATRTWADDRQMARDLVGLAGRAQQLQQIEPHVSEYLQNRDNYARWQAEQQAKAQEKPKLYAAPEWKPEWNNLVTRDQAGNVVPAPGADPAIVAKYHAYQRHRSDLAEKMVSDPVGFMQPVIEQVFGEKLNQALQQRLGEYDQMQANRQYLQQNAPWLYAHDAQTNQQLVNPQTGGPVLSEAGRLFTHHLQAGRQMGMPEQAQKVYAETMVRNAMYEMRLAQTGTQDAGAAVRQQVIESNRQPNRAGAITEANKQKEPQGSLRDQMLAAVADIPEKDFMSSLT